MVPRHFDQAAFAGLASPSLAEARFQFLLSSLFVFIVPFFFACNSIV